MTLLDLLVGVARIIIGGAKASPEVAVRTPGQCLSTLLRRPCLRELTITILKTSVHN